MREINITSFVRGAEPFEFSGSIAERGKNAANETWSNALMQASTEPLLKSPEDIEALKTHMKGFGAWGDDEIAAWTDQECNAMLIQLISGDMREADMEGDMSEFDWDAYDADDNIGHNISGSADGDIFYMLD